MSVRVHCRATSTSGCSGRWASGTSTPSGTVVTLVEQSATSRRIAPKARARARTARVSTRVKARARVSTRVKARVLGGTKATCTKERAITAARWGTSVPSAGSIGKTIRTRFAHPFQRLLGPGREPGRS